MGTIKYAHDGSHQLTVEGDLAGKDGYPSHRTIPAILAKLPIALVCVCERRVDQHVHGFGQLSA